MSESAPGGTWSVAFRQWRGERQYQEDDFGIVGGMFGGEESPPELLMVLADGMGGEVGGARASRCVVRTFLGRFGEMEGPTTARLNECLDDANQGLHDQVTVNPDLDGMGSTVVAAVYDGHCVSWLSVGDSPMWLFAEGQLTRLNVDHSMAPVLDRMVETGALSREEALTDRTRHMLRSAVTGFEVEKVDCDRHRCRLGKGDYLLVASDGLETLTEEDIEHYLGTANGDAEAAADSLFSAVQAARRPNQDNVTFLLLAGREHTPPSAEAESDRTMPAIVPLGIPVIREGKPTTTIIPRGGGAALLAVAGLVLAIGLTWWSLIDSPRTDSADESPPNSEAEAGAPAVPDSQALPAAADRAKEAAPASTGDPAEHSRRQTPGTADSAAADAPAASPAAPADSTTEPQPAEPANGKQPESADTRDTAVVELPEPTTQSEPRILESPAPVQSAPEQQSEAPAEENAAEAADSPDTVATEVPEPAEQPEPPTPETSDAATPAAPATSGPSTPSTPEPATE